MTQAVSGGGATSVAGTFTIASGATARLAGVDRMRGLVILLMALDHVRDFFHADALLFDPTDLTKTYPPLFLTRFITHYCAPTFVFLAGASAFLHAVQLGDPPALRRFLATRGLWLILLDAFVVSPVWALGFGKLYLGVLWAIGVGMIALAPMTLLSPPAVLAIGATIVLGHNLLDSIHASQFGAFAPFWSLIHEQGALPFGAPGRVFYPALPWVGIMAIGYGLGPLFNEPAARRDRILTLLGVAAIAAFIILRLTNFYGDPRPWSEQRDGVMTVFSVLNVTKYPPSLLYALVTLGPMLILLPTMERLGGVAGEVLATFGRTPLFIYILHLYAALAAGALLRFAEGMSLQQLRELGPNAVPPHEYGTNLAGVYVAWVAIMTALYPACRWYAGVKRRRRDWWLSYL
jgi:uncharacterized membrane protein